AALWLAHGLLAAFRGKGLVPDALVTEPVFAAAVGLGAAVAVATATYLALPISTTHALVGALVGAGFAAGAPVAWSALGTSFLLPLALSPFLALAATALLYPLLREARRVTGVQRELCVCVDGGVSEPALRRADGSVVALRGGLQITVADGAKCAEEYRGRVFGFDAQRGVDRAHLVSAGAVSFARGLNDTPKIAALLVAAPALGLGGFSSMAAVGAAMAFGGVFAARRVAATMSHGITPMTHGQGFTANLVTSALVTTASWHGMPVSTTHVSCGSLFGLGAVTGGARWKAIRRILGAWLLTLPVGALAAAVATGLLRATA
ncbi:MAG: inorganic phosphate transporter, partial [Planctomycetota bacterium]|nr:inorganic phosphate transporter [Planctomycetota bacterium]